MKQVCKTKKIFAWDDARKRHFEQFLNIPNVSSSFVWSGQDVASLAGQGSIYIIAKSELVQLDADEMDETNMQVICSFLSIT